jgi:hypothetical protein
MIVFQTLRLMRLLTWLRRKWGRQGVETGMISKGSVIGSIRPVLQMTLLV